MNVDLLIHTYLAFDLSESLLSKEKNCLKFDVSFHKMRHNKRKIYISLTYVFIFNAISMYQNEMIQKNGKKVGESRSIIGPAWLAAPATRVTTGALHAFQIQFLHLSSCQIINWQHRSCKLQIRSKLSPKSHNLWTRSHTFQLFLDTLDISRPGFKGCLPSRPKKGGGKTY